MRVSLLLCTVKAPKFFKFYFYCSDLAHFAYYNLICNFVILKKKKQSRRVVLKIHFVLFHQRK